MNIVVAGTRISPTPIVLRSGYVRFPFTVDKSQFFFFFCLFCSVANSVLIPFFETFSVLFFASQKKKRKRGNTQTPTKAILKAALFLKGIRWPERQNLTLFGRASGRAYVLPEGIHNGVTLSPNKGCIFLAKFFVSPLWKENVR